MRRHTISAGYDRTDKLSQYLIREHPLSSLASQLVQSVIACRASHAARPTVSKLAAQPHQIVAHAESMEKDRHRSTQPNRTNRAGIKNRIPTISVARLNHFFRRVRQNNPPHGQILSTSTNSGKQHQFELVIERAKYSFDRPFTISGVLRYISTATM